MYAAMAPGLATSQFPASPDQWVSFRDWKPAWLKTRESINGRGIALNWNPYGFQFVVEFCHCGGGGGGFCSHGINDCLSNNSIIMLRN